jgi:hypothetical protein
MIDDEAEDWVIIDPSRRKIRWTCFIQGITGAPFVKPDGSLLHFEDDDVYRK